MLPLCWPGDQRLKRNDQAWHEEGTDSISSHSLHCSFPKVLFDHLRISPFVLPFPSPSLLHTPPFSPSLFQTSSPSLLAFSLPSSSTLPILHLFSFKGLVYPRLASKSLCRMTLNFLSSCLLFPRPSTIDMHHHSQFGILLGTKPSTSRILVKHWTT